MCYWNLFFNILCVNECSIGNLGSGSDYTVFSHVLGVPCVDLYYDYQEVYFVASMTNNNFALIDNNFLLDRKWDLTPSITLSTRLITRLLI